MMDTAFDGSGQKQTRVDKAEAQPFSKGSCNEFQATSILNTSNPAPTSSVVDNIDLDRFTFTFSAPQGQVHNPFSQLQSGSATTFQPNLSPTPESSLYSSLIEFRSSSMSSAPEGSTSKSLDGATPHINWEKSTIEPAATGVTQAYNPGRSFSKTSAIYETDVFSQRSDRNKSSSFRQSETQSIDGSSSHSSTNIALSIHRGHVPGSKSSTATSPLESIDDDTESLPGGENRAQVRSNWIGSAHSVLGAQLPPKVYSFASSTAIAENEYDDMMALIPNCSRNHATDNNADRVKEYQTSPIFSRGAEAVLNQALAFNDQHVDVFSQFGLLGLQEKDDHNGNFEQLRHVRQSIPSSTDLIFTNTNAPWSAFICGSQGAGKSHTLSCLLENSLLKTRKLGRLPEPLSGVVFHYDKFSSASTTQICEAAYLCSRDIPVRVLVSPSNIWAMQRMYRDMPGMPATAPVPTVLPFYLSEKQLDISRILKLMAVATTENQPPLYMEMVITILREMAMAGPGNEGFSYATFRRRLQETRWIGGQQNPLSMRLSLLESFMVPSDTTSSTRPAAASEDIWAFPQGSLTIIDLSDPFVDENDACALFSICLSIFLEQRSTCGRVVALDEAHKFLTKSGEAKVLTDALTCVMREQRHTGTRVYIATQEPTLSPDLIDLANVTIVHRFLSPAWYQVLRQHLAGAQKDDKSGSGDLFETIVALETGQALLFCPTALVTTGISNDHAITPLGSEYMKIRIRARITADGGKSVMANDKSFRPKGFSVTAVPMHVVTKAPQSLFGPPPKKGKKHAGSSSQVPGATNSHTSVQATDHAQPKPQQSHSIGTVDTAKLTSTDDELSAMVRYHMRDRFQRGWVSSGCISWQKLWKQVECDLGLRPHYIMSSGRGDQCRDVALTEMNDCRLELGWKASA